jgi:hypothetical protein
MTRLPAFLLSALVAGLMTLPTRAADDKSSSPSMKVTEGRHIDLRCGEHLVARYVIDPSVPKPYFWPLNAPHGEPITRGWPIVKAEPGERTDHKHHVSAWFCHGDVIPEGMEIKHKIRGIKGIDFWSVAPGHGNIVCTKVGKPQEHKGGVRLTTHNEWQTADGEKVLDEDRTLTLYCLGDAQLIVVDIDLNASVVPITFGDTKEGSFAVRVRKSVTESYGKGHLTNAEGNTGEKGLKGVWGRISAWCDYSGPVGDKVAGVTIFADPKNPQPTAWHARGYGLMGANPFGRTRAGFPATVGRTDLVKLARGKHLKLRYGLYLHPGDVKEGKVAERYKVFVEKGKK